jgi:hypothetical protein
MMSVALWPTILVMIGDVWRSKRPVTRDVEDRLYSKLAYLVTKVCKQIHFISNTYIGFLKLESLRDFGIERKARKAKVTYNTNMIIWFYLIKQGGRKKFHVELKKFDKLCLHRRI